jgi:hypothetical protein
MAARSDDTGGGQKSGGALRVVGVVVLALAAIGFGAVRMGFIHLPGSSSDDGVLATNKPIESTTPDLSKSGSPVNGTSTKSASPTGETPDLDAPAVESGTGSTPATGATRRPGTRVASTSGAGAALVTAVTHDPVSTAAQSGRIDEHITYQYNALNRRDPFQSLLTGEYVPEGEPGAQTPPDPGGMRIVGIVWGATDQFAMVEDVRGNSYVLRKGDKLQNGYVEALRRDAVVVNVTADGQSQTVVIPFVRKGDASAH